MYVWCMMYDVWCMMYDGWCMYVCVYVCRLPNPRTRLRWRTGPPRLLQHLSVWMPLVGLLIVEASLPLGVCLHITLHIHTNAHTYTHTHTHTYIHTYTSTKTFTCSVLCYWSSHCLYVCMYVCVCVYVCMCMCVCEFYSGDQIDHCVQLAGYGTQSGTDYWIVRNSWVNIWTHFVCMCVCVYLWIISNSWIVCMCGFRFVSLLCSLSFTHIFTFIHTIHTHPRTHTHTHTHL